MSGAARGIKKMKEVEGQSLTEWLEADSFP